MEKSLLFIQPIVSHYRKSVVEEIIKLEPQSEFWGTNNFQGVEPLNGVSNVNNGFKVKIINIFNIKFVWYKEIVSKCLKHKSTHVILSGINPLLIQTFFIFIIIRFFTSKKVYWWSQGKRFKQGFFGKKFRYLFYNFSDGIFLYSEGGKRNFIAEGLPENKLHVINNCLNTEDYGWQNYYLEIDKKNEFRIVYTGRLSVRKKTIILLKAFKLLKEKGINDIYIDIVGDGDQLVFLKSYALNNKIDTDVLFHGSQYGIDVHKYFLNGDLVVCPGALGLSIVHSFSFGLPFLTGQGDPAHSSELELLSPGINGDYFQLDNAEDLANSILVWRNKIYDNKKDFQRNCVQTIINHEYLPHLVAEKLVKAL
jgi:glycosyltransferase involved in cell wall biosynthesis